MRKTGRYLILIAQLCLCGCALTQKINNKWPPISEDQQRQVAVESTAKALATLTAPTIAAEMSLVEAERVLVDSEVVKKYGVSKIELSGDKQLITIRVEFHHQFTVEDAGNNADLLKVIATSKPEVTGSILFYMGIKNPDLQAINLADIPALELQLLPGVGKMHLDDIRFFGNVNATALVNPIVALLNHYQDNISGVLTRAKFATIHLPQVASKPIALPKPFDFHVTGQLVHAVFTAHPITIPLHLTDLAWRIADDKITVLAQVQPTAVRPIPSDPLRKETFDEINARVTELLSTRFGITTSDASTWVAVQKELVAVTVDNAAAQAVPCLDLSISDISYKSPGQMISVAPSTADCRQDASGCGFSCSRNHADYHCGKFNVPCKARERVAQTGFDVEYGTCQAARAGKETACRGELAARQAGCEAVKQSFNGVVAGEVGELTPSVSGRAQAQICLSNLSVVDNLSNVSVGLEASGQATAAFSLDFEPRRIVGHAACVLPVVLSQNVNVHLSAPKWAASSPITLSSDGSDVFVLYRISGQSVEVSYDPSLAKVLLNQFPKLALKCPLAAGAVAGADISGFVEAIPNQFAVPIPDISGSQQIAIPTLTIGDDLIDVNMLPLTPEALIFEEKLQAHHP